MEFVLRLQRLRHLSQIQILRRTEQRHTRAPISVLPVIVGQQFLDQYTQIRRDSTPFLLVAVHRPLLQSRNIEGIERLACRRPVNLKVLLFDEYELRRPRSGFEHQHHADSLDQVAVTGLNRLSDKPVFLFIQRTSLRIAGHDAHPGFQEWQLDLIQLDGDLFVKPGNRLVRTPAVPAAEPRRISMPFPASAFPLRLPPGLDR